MDKDKKKLINDIKGYAGTILIGLVLSYIICKFIVVMAVVQGSSMYPTLEDGQRLLASKISYIISEPERFDVAIIENSYSDDMILIKRVIGLPGETVRIDEQGNIYINDEVLEENYGYEVMIDPGIALDGITLGENEYFVLGDNRNNSADSRIQYIGKIKQENFLAKALFIK